MSRGMMINTWAVTWAWCLLLAAQEPGAIDAPAWQRAAIERFQPVSAEQLESSRQTVLRQAAALQAVLETMPDGGVVARTIELPRLVEALQPLPGEPTTLRAAYRRLARSIPQECQAAVDQLRRALLKHRGLVDWAQLPQPQRAFAEAVETVAARLATPPQSRAEYEAFNAAYGLLARSGQIDDLLADVRRWRSHDNQTIVVHRALLEQMLERDIQSTMPIDQSSGKATVRGQAVFQAEPDVQLIPNERQGEFRVLVNGRGRVNLTARQKPATFHALGHTRFQGEQTMFVTSRGVELGEQSICVRNRTQLQSLCLDLRSRAARAVLTPIVRHVVTRKLPEGDRQIESRAREEISRQLADGSYALLFQFNSLLQRVLWQTVDARDVDPQVRASTDRDTFRWVAQVVTPEDLGAWSAPPEFAGAPVIRLQMHETALNNAGDVLADRRFNEVLFRELVFGNLRLQPDPDTPPEGRIPAAFTFAAEAPLHVQLDADRCAFQLRLINYELDGVVARSALRTVRVAYRPRLEQEGVVLDRLGPLEIDASDAADEAALRTTLERFFVPRMRAARASKASLLGFSLRVREMILRDGWLAVGVEAQK